MINFDVFTKDPEIGKKLLIGSLLALTGIGLFALVGWMIEILRRETGDPLPGFDDIGAYFLDGLRIAAVALVWSAPVIVLVVGISLLTVFAPSLFASEEDAVAAIVIANFCIVGLIFIYLLPMFILMVPAMGRLAETGSIRQAMSLKHAFRAVRANPGGILLAAVLGMLVNSLLGSLGALLCLVGIYPALVVSYGVQGQLYGAAYRDALANMEN